MKLDRTRASVVSIVVVVLTVVPSSKRFPVFMRESVNNTSGVITSDIMHKCVSCTPGSSFLGSFVHRIISRQLYFLGLVTLRISFHKLLNSLHSRLGAGVGVGRGEAGMAGEAATAIAIGEPVS